MNKRKQRIYNREGTEAGIILKRQSLLSCPMAGRETDQTLSVRRQTARRRGVADSIKEGSDKISNLIRIPCHGRGMKRSIERQICSLFLVSGKRALL